MEFKALVLVRELWNGSALAFPLADRALACLASGKDEALAEQRRFLAAYLSRIPAEQLSRFALPEGAFLRQVDVPLLREELPARLQMREPVSFSAVELPLRNEGWALLPALEHTLYIGRDEEPTELIRAEALRLIAALDLKPAELLRLLPGRAESLHLLTLRLEREGEGLNLAEGRRLRKQVGERQKARAAAKILASVAEPLHRRAVGPPILGREAELGLLGPLLEGKERRSILLTGPELAGKTSVLLAWLRKNPGRRVYSTSGAQLVAGMSGLGQWQERLGRVLRAAEQLDAILYFENFTDLLAERASSRMDLLSPIKSFVEEGRIRIIAELRSSALDHAESRAAAFLSCLHRVAVAPLSVETTRQALLSRHEAARANLTPEALQTLLDLGERYQPYLPLPGKAVRLYEELRAVYQKDLDEQGQPRPITSEKALEAFSWKTGIPAFLLREDRALVAGELIRRFQERLVGQESAIRALVETLCVVKAGLQPTGKPLATFLFLGPTGVGKTELARLLAVFLFGSAERLVRFDMSEYMDGAAAERLIRGTSSADGLLTRKAREQPFCVILLDEIEKAHPAVFDLLLQVCGEGRLTDARGKTAFFHNAILILTSNLGAASYRNPIGLGESRVAEEAYYQRQVHQAFRPEFVNRLDRIVVFKPLTADQQGQVARLAVERISERRGLVEAGLELELDPAALASLARDGVSEKYGARAMRRHLENALVSPLSRALSKAGPDARSALIQVGLAGSSGAVGASDLSMEFGGLDFAWRRKAGGREKGQLASAFKISALRREADRCMRLDTVQQVRDRISFLTFQLNQPRDRRSKTPGAQMVELQTEQHRLVGVWDAASRLQGELETLEELALVGLFEGEELSRLLEEAERVREKFRHNLVGLLTIQVPRRDEISLIASEAEGRAFELWLVPLLRQAAARGWRILAHVKGDASREAAWPETLQWGPPIEGEALLRRLEVAGRNFRSVLLRVRGESAGALLALEAGLHRWRPASADEELSALSCQSLALRSELSVQDLAKAQVEGWGLVKNAAAVREHVPAEDRLYLLQKKRVIEPMPGPDYWAGFERIALEHLLEYEEDPERELMDLYGSTL